MNTLILINITVYHNDNYSYIYIYIYIYISIYRILENSIELTIYAYTCIPVKLVLYNIGGI